MAISNSPNPLLETLTLQLTRVAQDKDKDAFASLFDHYAPLIRSYSLAREPGAALVADELAQEVMTKIWLKAASYNSAKANLNTWIFTLARNCRIDYLRRNSRHVSDIDPTDIFSDLADESPSPFHLVHQSRAQESVSAGLAQLPRNRYR